MKYLVTITREYKTLREVEASTKEEAIAKIASDEDNTIVEQEQSCIVMESFTAEPAED